MDQLPDKQLLRDYTQQRSEEAFAELVKRHVDFVYSAALRMTRDSHLAQDVTQSAFLALAQNAHRLTDQHVIPGWLHRTARNLAIKTIRSDSRRRAREQEAAAMNELHQSDALWEEIAPHLDEALAELSSPDRDALFLRYFQRQSARQIAEALHTSEEAAQKRVTRAVERLRDMFLRRGVTIGASGLVVALSAHGVQAAPIGLGTVISTTAGAVAKTSMVTGKLLSLKVIASAIAALLVGGGGIYLAQQFRTATTALAQSPSSGSATIRNVRGILKTPDGKPLDNAIVYLSTGTTPVPVYATPGANVLSTRTDRNGKFTFASDPDNRAVIVIHEQGYAQATVNSLAANQELKLQPWARVGGTLREGKIALANQTIQLSRTRFGSKIEQQRFRAVHNVAAKTDAQGHYSFARVAPGDAWVSWNKSGAGGGYGLQYRYVDVPPGETLLVDIGGRGRPISGRAVQEDDGEARGRLYGSVWPETPHQMPRPRNWQTFSEEERSSFVEAWEKTPDAKLYNQEKCPIDFRLGSDGRFTVSDLSPGNYRLVVAAWAGAAMTSKMLGRGQLRITVPEVPGGQSDEPLDVGEVHVISNLPLRVDDPAPQFEGTTFSGTHFALADCKGKYVLLHFWRTISPESVTDLVQLQAAHAKWGKDKRFVLVGVNFDANLADAQKFANDKKLTWTQCYVGGLSDLQARYRLRKPSAFLIGPEGLIINPDLGGPGIETALAEVLGAK